MRLWLERFAPRPPGSALAFPFSPSLCTASLRTGRKIHSADLNAIEQEKLGMRWKFSKLARGSGSALQRVTLRRKLQMCPHFLKVW